MIQAASKKKTQKRKKSQPSRDGCTNLTKANTQPKKENKSNGIAKNFIKFILDKGVTGIKSEFRALAKYSSPEMTMNSFLLNAETGKNRYSDVPCQDQHRVVLKWPSATSNYVHANFVATPLGPKRFLCTQGPLDVTIKDFWTMVLQEDSETILMLCNCIETGFVKCAQYWPNSVGEVRNIGFGDIEITHKESRPMSAESPTVILAILSVKFDKPGGGKETREIRHYQWTDWPDRGVPPCTLTVMELLSRVRGTQKPIVVHCSACIGRTGTIVAIEYILEKIQAGEECTSMEALKSLRRMRAYVIQKEMQYLFVHRILLSYLFEKQEAIFKKENETKYKKFLDEYRIATQKM